MKTKLTTRLGRYVFVATMMIAAAVALIWIVLQGYSAAWTGFGNFTKPDGEFVRGKTLWDWIQLLILPLIGSIGVYLLNYSERVRERQRTEENAKLERQRAEERAALERQRVEKHAELERELATDHQREAALQSYLDRMAKLLIEQGLRTPDSEEVRNVARIWTLTLLQRLDGTRKGIVLRFIREAGLIYKEHIIIQLSYADLRNAVLRGATLGGTDLSVADLQYADLVQVDLKNADLSCADLQKANLQTAFLGGANLNCAKLQNVNLQDAYLKQANLPNADLQGANLKGAKLQRAELKFARLQGADLSYAELQDANLFGADLTSAIVTNEQLATVKSLEDATLPDGTKHDGL